MGVLGKLEKIVNLSKKIAFPSLLIGSLVSFSLPGCGGLFRDRPPLIEETVEEDYSPEELSTEVTTTLIDDNNNEYTFLNCHTNPSFIETDFKSTLATIFGGGVYHLIDFSKIERIEKTDERVERIHRGITYNNEIVNVYLKDNTKISGNWISNNETGNFYCDSENPFERGYIYGVHNNISKKIRIGDIKKITFDARKVKNSEQEDKDPIKVYWGQNVGDYHPKEIELDNGQRISTDEGYIIDFCGHGWGCAAHIRMTDSCPILDFEDGGWDDRSLVHLEELTEVSFTGDFHPEYKYKQCREITLKYKDDKEQKTHLFLTFQSIHGTCNHYGGLVEFDKMYARQDYGAMLIPLGEIKRVTPGSQKEVKSNKN